MTRITGTLREDQYTFLIILRSVLLRVRNVSDKNCWENQNAHFMFNTLFFENRAIYEIMRKIFVEPGRPLVTIRSVRISSWISKATNTHSEYVILTAFPL